MGRSRLVRAALLPRLVTARACVAVVSGMRASLVAARRAHDHARQFGGPSAWAFGLAVAQALPALAFASCVRMGRDRLIHRASNVRRNTGTALAATSVKTNTAPIRPHGSCECPQPHRRRTLRRRSAGMWRIQPVQDRRGRARSRATSTPRALPWHVIVEVGRRRARLLSITAPCRLTATTTIAAPLATAQHLHV